VALKGLK